MEHRWQHNTKKRYKKRVKTWEVTKCRQHWQRQIDNITANREKTAIDTKDTYRTTIQQNLKKKREKMNKIVREIHKNEETES